MTTIRLRLHTNLDGGVALITPDIITQILGNLPGRIEAVRTSTDEMIVAMGQRWAALEEAIARRPLPPAADRQSAIDARLAEDRPRVAPPLEQQDAKPCAHSRWAITIDDKYQCLDCWMTLESQPAGVIQPAHVPPLAVVDSGLTSVTDPAAGACAKPDADEAGCPSEERMRGWSHKEYISHVRHVWDQIAALRQKNKALRAKLDRSDKHFEETTDKLMVAAGVDLGEFKSDGEYGVEDMENIISAQGKELTRERDKALAELAAERAKLPGYREILAAAQRVNAALEKALSDTNSTLIEARATYQKAMTEITGERDALRRERDSWHDQHKIACAEIKEAEARNTELRRENEALRNDRNQWKLDEGKAALERDKALAELAAAQSRIKDGSEFAKKCDRLEADLAAATERAERREWINHENAESVKARLAGYLMTKELVPVERLDAARADADALAAILTHRPRDMDARFPVFAQIITLALAAHDAARKGAT